MIKGPEGNLLTILSDSEVCRIHETSLKVLGDVGIATDSDLILDAFSDAGAPVDRDAKKIIIPVDFVEAALKTVPGTIVLHGRRAERDLLVEGKRVYFGLGGSPPLQFRDVETGLVRASAKADVARATLLGDALPNISFVMSLAGAYDFAPGMHYLHEYDALLSNTCKPIIYSAPSARYAARFLQIAAAVLGGEDELRKRPIVTLFAESVSPLCLSSFSEGMAEFAKVGAPILFSPSPMMGATSPATVSGSLVVGNAEALAGICYSQILSPGTPVIYGPHTPVMDMKTARSTYAGTEQAVGRTAVAQLAQFYGIPSFGTGAGTDSKCPDSQAGAEVTMNIFLNAMAGMNLSQGAGTMAGGGYGCLEMAVICDEVMGMAMRVLEGIAVDEESLALEVISGTGPGGHFLDSLHTAKFFTRDMFFPKLFDRQSEAAWSEAGGKETAQVASERALQILSEHKPERIPDSAGDEITRILKESEQEFG